jgi:hypothetical protein
MARPIKRLETEPAVTEELRRRLRSRTCLVRERERAEIVLLRLEGIGVAEIAARLKTTAKRVSTWSKRFETRGLAGLEEAAGRGRKPSVPDFARPAPAEPGLSIGVTAPFPPPYASASPPTPWDCRPAIVGEPMAITPRSAALTIC